MKNERSATWEDITPEKAEGLLEMNISNRAVKKQVVERYAKDMASGNWKENGVPIVIGSDGTVKDGQHRLLAIKTSGVTLHNQLLVIIPAEDANAYDIGTARTFADVATFEGYGDNPAFRCNTLCAAFNVARFIGKENREKLYATVSKVDTLHEMIKYQEELTWVYQNFCGNTMAKITNAGTTAAILNAYLSGYPKEKLARFCDVLKSGCSVCTNEITIVALRNYLLKSEMTKGGRKFAFDIYYKVQKSLYNYKNDIIVNRVVACNTEHYKFIEKECIKNV